MECAARLVEEAADHLLVRRQFAAKDLDGCLAAETRMFRQIDGSHPSLANEPGQPVVPDTGAEHFRCADAAAPARA